jgi:hypothetical protein
MQTNLTCNEYGVWVGTGFVSGQKQVTGFCEGVSEVLGCMKLGTLVGCVPLSFPRTNLLREVYYKTIRLFEFACKGEAVPVQAWTDP